VQERKQLPVSECEVKRREERRREEKRRRVGGSRSSKRSGSGRISQGEDQIRAEDVVDTKD
jgi:hypothetical protein